MSKSKRRQLMEKSARRIQPTTHTINPNVAKQPQIIFNFQWLDLKNRASFVCTSGHGESLLYVFETLRLFSSIGQRDLIGYKNCHPIPDDQVKKHFLEDIVLRAPSKKLFQMGRERTRERIIGYFSDYQLSLFQVCLLDLNHNLSNS